MEFDTNRSHFTHCAASAGKSVAEPAVVVTNNAA